LFLPDWVQQYRGLAASFAKIHPAPNPLGQLVALPAPKRVPSCRATPNRSGSQDEALGAAALGGRWLPPCGAPSLGRRSEEATAPSVRTPHTFEIRPLRGSTTSPNMQCGQTRPCWMALSYVVPQQLTGEPPVGSQQRKLSEPAQSLSMISWWHGGSLLEQENCELVAVGHRLRLDAGRR